MAARLSKPRYVFLSSNAGSRLARTDRRLLNVMLALKSEDSDVELVCAPGSPIEKRALDARISVATTRISPVNVLATRARVRDYVRRHRPQIAHSTGWLADWALRAAASDLPGVAVVNTEECLDWPARPAGGFVGWRRRLMRSNLSRADALVVDCTQLANQLLASGVSETRFVFDPPSVDVARVRGEVERDAPLTLPGHPPHVGYAGALVRSRGLGVLAQAAAILDMRRAKATIVIAGSGPAARDLADDVAARRVHLIENPKSVPAVLSAFDVCVFPVLEPGMPTTLLEAAVLGRPIVSSDVPGISDLFVDGRQISIVPPDDPKALAAAIARLLDEPALAAEMAARAQRHALEHLSSAASIDRHRELYARLLAGEFGAAAAAPDASASEDDSAEAQPVENDPTGPAEPE